MTSATAAPPQNSKKTLFPIHEEQMTSFLEYYSKIVILDSGGSATPVQTLMNTSIIVILDGGDAASESLLNTSIIVILNSGNGASYSLENSSIIVAQATSWTRFLNVPNGVLATTSLSLFKEKKV